MPKINKKVNDRKFDYKGFEQIVVPVKQKLNESGINIESLLLKSFNQALNNFIMELEPSLTPEKLE